MRTRKNISHAGFLLGPTGKIATWNAACQRMLGYPGAAVLLRPISSILEEPTRKVFQERLKQMRGDAEKLDADIILADGSVSSFKLIFIPQFRQSGKFWNYSVMIEPACAPASARASRRTGRRMAEPDRIGATQLKDIINFLTGTFYVINQSGRLVMWNKRVEQATQMTRIELAAIFALELFGDNQRKCVGDAIDDVFMHDGEMLVEADLLAKSGKARPYIFSGSRFEAGGHFYLCGMGLEISDLRKQGEQLRLRERALHASSNGIVITRCLGKNNPVEYVNPAFERITGYRTEEAIQRDMRFLAAPGLDEAERTLLRAAIIERREINVVFRNLRKNGEVFWNDLTVTPVLDEAGTATHFIGVINDVTVSCAARRISSMN